MTWCVRWRPSWVIGRRHTLHLRRWGLFITSVEAHQLCKLPLMSSAASLLGHEYEAVVQVSGIANAKVCILVTGGRPAEVVWRVEVDTQPTRHHSPPRMSHSNVSGSSLNRCTSTSLRAKLRTDSRDQKKPILLNMNTQPQQKIAVKLGIEWTLFYFARWQLESSLHIILSCHGNH